MDVQYQRCSHQNMRVAPQNFTLACMEGVDVQSYGRMVTKTKFSCTDGIANNDYANFWGGVKGVFYGVCASRE